MAATKVPVSQVTGLRATSVTPHLVALAWNAPAKGTPPIGYTAFYRQHGAVRWIIGTTSKVTSAAVAGLAPATEYDFEILAHNA